MAIQIRPAAPQDRHALGALKLRASLAWGDHLQALQSMPDVRVVPAEHLPFMFVAEDAGRILGSATTELGPALEMEKALTTPG